MLLKKKEKKKEKKTNGDFALSESTPCIGQVFIGFKKSYMASIDHPFDEFTNATI